MIPVTPKVKLGFHGALHRISMQVAVSSVAAMCLLSACGGSNNAPPSASNPPTKAPIAPQSTPATVAPTPQLAALAADQPYVDNTQYDASPGASLPIATEDAAVTHHRIVLKGVNQTYTATAGHLTIRDPDTNTPTGTIFYTAYTLDSQDTTKRPVTVFFNGGPGSPSSFLHMGSFAPMRVFTKQGSTVSGPQDVTLGENPQTLLDATDMIFVDPVGTGFSEAIAPSKNSDFWGVNSDVASFAAFINRYLTINNRGTSPLMVYGESYGGPRAGILSYALHNIYNIKLSGLIMQSPALNFYEGASIIQGGFTQPRRSPIPPFLLPTVTMAAQYFGKITDPTLSKLSLPDLFQASENFTFNTLTPILAPSSALYGYDAAYGQAEANGTTASYVGNPLAGYEAEVSSPGYAAFVENQPILAAPLVPQFQALTGKLPVLADPSVELSGALPADMSTLTIQTAADVVEAANKDGMISQSLVQTLIPGSTLGLYDLRKGLTGDMAATQNGLTGFAQLAPPPSSALDGNYLVYDPSLNDMAAYDSIFSSYAYNTLKYQTVSDYHGLSGTIGLAWTYTTTYPDASILPFPDATIFIADEMQINPSMQVITTAGYYDSVVPAAQVDWDMQSVSAVIPKTQMANMYTRLLYPGGHMSYADDTSRQEMHDNYEAFYVKATQTTVPSMK